MRRCLAAAAFILALAAHAAAQQTLPPNSVWGRLGAGNPGPGEAIPLSTLQQQIFGQTAAPLTSTIISNVTTIGLGFDSNFTVNGSNKLALSSAADSDILANITGVSAEPTATTPTGWLNHWCSSSQFNFPQAGASSWQCGTISSLLVAGTGISLSGTGQVTISVSGSNFVTNAMLAQAGAATFKGNPTGALANEQDFTLSGLSLNASPSPNNDLVPCFSASSGTIEKCTVGSISSASTAGVTSLNGLTAGLSIVQGTGITVAAAGSSITVTASTSPTIDANGATAVSNGVLGAELYETLAGKVGPDKSRCNPGAPSGGDDSAAWDTCLLALNAAGGGSLILPGSHYRTYSGIVPSGIVPTATNSSTASGNGTLHFATTPANIANGMVALDLTNIAALTTSTGGQPTISSFTGTTVVLSANATLTVNSGDIIAFANPNISINIIGASHLGTTSSGTLLETNNHNVPTLTLTQRGSLLSNLTVWGQGNTGDTAGQENYPALRVTDCVHCEVNHVDTFYGSYSTEVAGNCDCILYDVNASAPYGLAGLHLIGTGNCADCITSGWLIRDKADGTFPTGTSPSGYSGNGTINAFATGQAYAANTVITANSWYWQCMNCNGSLTSGGTTPSPTTYGSNVSDGTLNWQMVRLVGASNVMFDSGSFQWSALMLDATGPYTYNVRAVDNQTWTSAAMGLLQFDQISAGQGFSANVIFSNGGQNKITNSTIDSCYTVGCVGVYLNSNFVGDLTLAHSTLYGGTFGFLWGAGNNVIVDGNVFSGYGTLNTDGGSAAAIFAQTGGLTRGTFDNNISSATNGTNAKFWNISGGPTFVTMCGNDGSNISGTNTISVASHLSPATYGTCNN